MYEHLINLPVKVLFGCGKAHELCKYAPAFGKRAFLLIDPFLEGSDLIKAIVRELSAEGVESCIYSDVTANPRDDAIDRAAALCVADGCGFVIAVGGGSAIDSAKATAITARNGGNCWLYTRRENEEVLPVANGRLPLIAIPTTAGTGTEATPYAVINNPERRFKATIVSEYCFPDLSIVDPDLMVSMPPMLTALTGIDAFAHAFEAYCSKYGNRFSNMAALEAMRLFSENIRECCNDGENRIARGNMALCSLLGGIAIAHASTTLPHAIGQPLSGLTDAPHGGSIACCIGSVIRWTLPYAQEQFANVAELFDPSIKGLPVTQKAERLAGIIPDLFAEIMHGNRVTMRTYGLRDDQIGDMADMTMNCYFSDCALHPRVPSRDDIVSIIRESL